jgi:hypothetical protein
MQTVTSMEQIAGLRDNRIIGNFDFVKSKVTFNGKGNVLIADISKKSANIILRNTAISFNNDNSVAFLSESDKSYSISLGLSNKKQVLYLTAWR